jgi:hypothetical protein
MSIENLNDTSFASSSMYPSSSQNRRSSLAASEASSDYQSFKEEFEKKEVEYNKKIQLLKKEVQFVKESLRKINDDMQEVKDRGNNPQALYSLLDE